MKNHVMKSANSLQAIQSLMWLIEFTFTYKSFTKHMLLSAKDSYLLQGGFPVAKLTT